MIRLASEADLPAVMAVYRAARAFMAENGNASQWGDSYPDEELLRYDIAAKQLYVFDENGAVHGAFALCDGPDPNYAVIENGSWQSDTPYAVIHRLAGDGTVRGLFARCTAFSAERCPHLRADTHENNCVMQHLLNKNGFSRRGIIHDVEIDSTRIAYDRVTTQA